MSYGPNQEAYFPRAVDLADQILRGSKVEVMPIERPTTFEFVVNAITAKQLRIDLPPVILARADEIIE